MVCAAGSCRIHAGEQHTCDVMLACKGMVIIEMAIPSNGLAISCVRHGHVTGHNLIVLLGKGYNLVIYIIVTPSGDEHRILVVV